VSVTPDQIRGQLERILASAGFRSADRAARFFRYVVERTLAGEGDQLKEYVIGLEVFDRGQDYDPRVDSIVRVEAGRLRSKVDEYYAGPGRTDEVVIQLRRGGYAPTFEQRAPETVAGPSSGSRRKLGVGLVAAALVVLALVAWRGGIWATAEYDRQPPALAIAVLPFASYSTDPAGQMLAARVTDGITSELARLGTLGVVSHTSAQQFAGVRQPLREIAQALEAQLILEGNVREEAGPSTTLGAGRVIIQVRLVDAAIDRKFWVQDFAGSVAEIPELQRQIAKGASDAAMQRQK
jgi:TolB-like protein